MDTHRESPIYNIKAVVRMTGVPADTLRRWESRYTIIVPQRTESGYRLYSQRDVDTILWLKARLAEGLSISRASEMLRQMGGDPAAAPMVEHAPRTVTPPGALLHEARSTQALREELLRAFRAVDEDAAAQVMSEALSLYSIEDVSLQILQPALVEVGELWLDGEVSVATEHFASSFVRSRLANLFHSSPHNAYGPLVLVGCAPDEFHELGAMFLAVFLRRAGFRVVYLGQNVPLDSLQGMIAAMKPDAVCISATRAETAASLVRLSDYLAEMQRNRGRAPLLAYGGQVFNRYPHITERLGGAYLGEDARAAVNTLSEKLRPRQ
ncbi:MAG TPA: MerR family transcriptional regulator [Chloroflexia bacterium]|nr:MerR family transcriptional regulator [Chloroflexia bacterium]